MKKMVVIILMMVIMVVSVSAIAEVSYWDQKTIEWLYEDTYTWLKDHGYENWDRHHYEDGLILGYSVVTEDLGVSSSNVLEQIHNQDFVDQMSETLGTEIHSIDAIYYGQESGYDIYRIIIKWNDPIVTDIEFGSVPIYGVDQFVRFYN